MLLMLKIKYLVLVIEPKKLTITQKLIKLKESTTDHDHDKYFSTQEFNNLTSEKFTARLKQVNLESKNDIANFLKRQLLIIN